MSASFELELDEAGVVRLAELLALKARPGEAIALQGELGSGKTTFARAFIAAMLGSDAVEVPSPTFSLAQTYAASRAVLTHFDFYRLGRPDEVDELGFAEALENGIAIVEWPERVPGSLPGDRFEIRFTETADPRRRRVAVRGAGRCAAAVVRTGELGAFLDRANTSSGARIRHLQGDASTRSYARLTLCGGTALLMDAPRQPDGPSLRFGKPYSQIARLAEDVRPFVAIAGALKRAGLSTPQILDLDLHRGILLIEDFGDRTYLDVLREGLSQEELYAAAVEVLLHLKTVPLPRALPLPDGSSYVLPRRDRAAFEIETELLLDWLWPALKGAAAPPAVRREFSALWAPIIDRLLALPGGWFLRDYHSPNLFWLPERTGVAKVGVIDFQDALNEHAAFDLLALLQDARVDIPEGLERGLFEAYCERVAAGDPHFDKAAFAGAYADFGAQRNTRLLGLWVRLLRRDGKPQYLAHLPRTWGYLARNLRDARLGELAAWYERHFPTPLRATAIRA
jgi:tRNA threonylcarbamoyl adenosine modification protein YjeE